jgi:hypothetical protein
MMWIRKMIYQLPRRYMHSHTPKLNIKQDHFEGHVVTENSRKKHQSPITTPYFALSPLSELSPYSTQTSTSDGGFFSELDFSIESETGVESVDVEFGRDAKGGLMTIEHVLAVVDPILFSALGQNFNFATHIILEFRKRLWLAIDSESGIFKFATPQGIEERSKPGEVGDNNLSLPSQSNTRALSAKRGRGSEEPEDGNEEENRDSRKRRRKSPNENSEETKLFACHFFKKDPIKYSDWNPRFFKKYGGCTGPVGRGEFRRIL